MMNSILIVGIQIQSSTDSTHDIMLYYNSSYTEYINHSKFNVENSVWLN